MKAKFLSRSTELDNEKCVENVGGNRFNLVLIAAERSREIKRQNKDSDKREHVYSAITALTEIQEGKIGEDYLKKIKFKEPGNIDRQAKYN
jgi:DNA-directed RNA polymerase omega subunit